MRRALLVVLAAALALPGAQAAGERQRTDFAVADGFSDLLTVVSGLVDLEADATGSTAFFRTSGTTLEGMDRVCWSMDAPVPQCVTGDLTIAIAPGSSFGFTAPDAYPVAVEADHALALFVDLSRERGYADLEIGASTILSLVGGEARIGPLSPLSAGAPGALALLEPGGAIEVREAGGALVRRVLHDDPPLSVSGEPSFGGPFAADVAVVPFAAGSEARFAPADRAAAAEGLSERRLDLLDEVLRNARFLDEDAKALPRQILDRAGAVLGEVFNGAILRARLSDAADSLGDLGFAKFDELTVEGGRRILTFDGSYTLVVGDLGGAFSSSGVSAGSEPLRWWVAALGLAALAVVSAWLALREGPLPPPEPGPHTRMARIATAIGAVVAFLVWDWQLHALLGSSILTTGSTGFGLGAVAFVELASLGLAALLVGVPVYLIARYTLALARQGRLGSLASTAAVFLTLGIGLLLMPALVGVALRLVA